LKKRSQDQEKPISEPEAPRKSHRLNQLIVDQSNDLVAIHKLADLSYEYANLSTLKVLGYSQEELFAQTVLELIHPEDIKRVMEKIKESMPDGEGHDEFRYRKKDGTYIWLQVTGTIVHNEGDAASLVIIARDITERKQAQALQHQGESLAHLRNEFNRIDRAFKILSAANRAMVQAENEQDLLKTICQQIVEVGNYKLAWVGYVTKDQEEKVKPVVYAGDNNGYLTKVHIDLQDLKRGRGTIGNAIRTGQPLVCRDIKKDGTVPWVRDALRRGFKSDMAIPLTAGNKAFGVLTVYADQIDAFDLHEQQLLIEVANNLSYAIMALRNRNGR
jgi:PAS domain S-box-containing protein